MDDMAVTNDAIEAALSRGHTIEITTAGRRSGRPRRIEIVFHNIGGRIFISGIPARNTFHLKGRLKADLPATARVITDETERREVLPEVARNWGRNDLEQMVLYSPLIEVMFPNRA